MPRLRILSQTYLFMILNHLNKKTMKTFTKFSFIALLLFSINSFGQTDTTQLIKDWQRAKAYTLEYLETMPESGYALKPTPDMRSFAEQMLHLTDGNYGLASAALGQKNPIERGASEKSTDKSKANTIKMVMAGYDFIIQGIKKMNPSQYGENIKMFGDREMTRLTALNKCFEHQTHHRGQTTVYIRLAGTKPPQEKLF